MYKFSLTHAGDYTQATSIVEVTREVELLIHINHILIHINPLIHGLICIDQLRWSSTDLTDNFLESKLRLLNW